MVEQLSFLSIIVVVILAISLVIPTRRRTQQVISRTTTDNGNQTAMIDLMYSLAVNAWTVNNTARLESADKRESDNDTLLGLFHKLLESSPQDWIDSRSRLVKQSKLVSICESLSDANTKWCFFAFHCDIDHESTEPNSLTADLAFREIAKQWFETLAPYGLVSGSDRHCLLLALPYGSYNEESREELCSVAMKMHSALSNCSVEVNSNRISVRSRTRFTAIESEHSIEETLQYLLNDEDSASKLRCYQSGEWRNLDVTNDLNSTQFETDEEGNAIVSPEKAAQLVANSKTTPAAVCIKDDSEPIVEPPVTQQAAKTSSKPVSNSLENPKSELAPTAAKPAVTTTSSDLSAQSHGASHRTEDEETDVDSGKAEAIPTDAVSSSDIDELFAIARRRKDQNQTAAQEPTDSIASPSTSDEEATLASIKEIQEVADSTQAEPQATELDSLSSTDAVTADDIAKLFAAAKAKG